MSLLRKRSSEEQLLSQLRPLLSGLGEYALHQGNPAQGDKMLREIQQVEDRSKDERYPRVLVDLAIAYRFYTSWYVRGEARKTYLTRAVENLEKALTLDPSNQQAKTELAYLLVNYVPVRDLERGIELLESLKKENALSETMAIYLNQAYRQLDRIPEQLAIAEFSKVSMLPASLREDRKRYRTLVRQFRKNEQAKEIREVLDEFYNLAILVCAAYGNHDCDRGVSSSEYEIAELIRDRVAGQLQFSYPSSGRIVNGGFLSESDYRSFFQVFGETDACIDPQQYFEKDIRSARVQWDRKQAKESAKRQAEWEKLMKGISGK